MIFSQLNYVHTIPSIGDRLYYEYDHLPTNVNLVLNENNKFWNFTQLDSPSALITAFKKASEGNYHDHFLKSDLVSIDGLNTETYYKLQDNKLYIDGLVTTNSNSAKTRIIKKYTGGFPVYKNHYHLDSPPTTSRWECIFANHDEEESKFHQLYKVICNQTINDHVEEDGVLFLPTDRFEVFKRVLNIHNTYQFYEKKSEKWIEINAIDLDKIPIKLPEYEKEIFFINPESKGVIAHLTVDEEDNIQSVRFKSDPSRVKWTSAIANKKFYLYPNPAFDNVRLDFNYLKKGTYHLEIYDIIGQKLWEKEYNITKPSTIQENISFLRKGTYIYSLTDENGNKLYTHRLVVLSY